MSVKSTGASAQSQCTRWACEKGGHVDCDVGDGTPGGRHFLVHSGQRGHGNLGRGPCSSGGGNGSAGTAAWAVLGAAATGMGGVKMRKGFTLGFAIILTGLSSQSELDCHTPREIIYDFK